MKETLSFYLKHISTMGIFDEKLFAVFDFSVGKSECLCRMSG
jgi:hypothetical protein